MSYLKQTYAINVLKSKRTNNKHIWSYEMIWDYMNNNIKGIIKEKHPLDKLPVIPPDDA